jgi:hypothetical protein
MTSAGVILGLMPSLVSLGPTLVDSPIARDPAPVPFLAARCRHTGLLFFPVP